MGNQKYGIDSDVLSSYAKDIKSIVDKECQIAIVIGGGNIYRGIQSEKSGFDRVQGDHMGMLATIINGMALQSALESLNIETRLQTAIRMEQIAEPYIRRRAIRHLEKNRVVIFGGGTGNPYFTTDTAASLRAAEIDADIVLKSTRVEGVYSSDPEKNDNADLYSQISYKDVVEKKLGVMDLTAITLCEENKMPIRVFDGTQNTNIYNVLTGNELGTLIN